MMAGLDWNALPLQTHIMRATLFSSIMVMLLVAFPRHALAQDGMAALQAQDIRLATLAERIMRANADLCTDTMPLTGLVLHSRDQYGGDMDAAFANGPVAIAAVLPGSPAEVAGLAEGDAILAIDGVPVMDLPVPEDAPRRDAVFDAIASTTGMLPLRIRRDEEERAVTLDAPAGCRSLVEVLAQDGVVARSDGRVIQISFGLARELDDEQLAVLFAHELGHAVLHHRARLAAAGVEKGFFGEFGRSRRIGRAVEIEADRMAVYLLYNAGYDPAIDPAFWNSDASGFAGGGIFRSRLYPSRRDRAKIAQEEIDRLPAIRESTPYLPHDLLNRREVPFAD